MQLRIDILGPLRTTVDGYPADVQAEIERRIAQIRPRDWLLLVRLATTSGGRSTRELLGDLWPERDYPELFTVVESATALEAEVASAREIIDSGVAQLHNSASRLRKALKAAAPGDRNPVNPTRGQGGPAAGGYALKLNERIFIDAAEFTALVTKKQRSDEDRRRACELIRGSILQGRTHRVLSDARLWVRRRVRDAVAALLPQASDELVDRIARDIAQYGTTDQLDTQLRKRRVLLPDELDRPQTPDAADVDYLPQTESTPLSEVAASTFRDLLLSWAGEDAVVWSPVAQVVQAELSSYWGDVEPIRLTFVVFASPSSPDIVPGLNDRGSAYERTLLPREVEQLRDYVATRPRAYFVLAVPRARDESVAQLLDLAPAQRFDWYAVDGVQYFHAPGAPDHLLFPTQNVFNLATFSLTWASRWTENFFAPIRLDDLARFPALREQISLVFSKAPNRGLIRERGWDLVTRDLPTVRSELDDALFRKVNFRVGVGSAIELICGQLMDSAPRLDQVRTYCPEALYGTANLWLFSRAYHHFMTTTTGLARGNHGFVNQRLLPADGRLDRLPRMFALTLWHVMLYYRMLRAQVRIIARPSAGATVDHGYYGSGIGHFQWIGLSADGGDWVLNQEHPSVQREHLEFLNDHEQEVLVGPEMSDRDFARIAGITPDSQLELPTIAPYMLFPPEDEFIEHPSILWSNAILTARTKGIQS